MTYLVELWHKTELSHNTPSVGNVDRQSDTLAVSDFTIVEIDLVQANHWQSLVLKSVEKLHELVVNRFAFLLRHVLDSDSQCRIDSLDRRTQKRE